ncbi:hypothetical protein [Microbulbifer thermotolerans]|uniref:Uncharacterized protein n=1 Tax=Microbulbifer thermotolerans TaxID=252514 RepID=A0A143HNU6_MICTH|nr:hypothetical protein [Microbulbifer thermotolerans]AMX03393.1 hypothetical protein A3224_13105 [Microbulbifer thermotolerans]MCX2781208.1 hypothetical protein [Microbulbifer thermotolerans]MCX2795446.1 hypothetical protein [Microbulbifer thermotolerans]MCX2803478.1 hypothetical protein [Microbulbifer thermotolerans]
MADIVILAVPGMGVADEEFAEPLFAALREGLGDDWSRLHCDTVLCQVHLQTNIERTFEGMQKRDMDFLRARKFMLYGMAESAAQLGDIHQRGGNYEKAQQTIYNTLERAAKAASDSAPVVLLTHSVGCVTLSNYLWDAQKTSLGHGIWRDGGPRGVHKGSARDLFLRLKTLSHWYTLGATNPLWCAGMPRDQIQAVTSATRGYNFRWKNFYHPDDLFGWPLKPLSPSYNQAVYRDYEICPLSDWSASHWGPQLVSHNGYWRSEMVYQQLLEDLRALLKSHRGRRPAAPVRTAAAAAL